MFIRCVISEHSVLFEENMYVCFDEVGIEMFTTLQTWGQHLEALGQ